MIALACAGNHLCHKPSRLIQRQIDALVSFLLHSNGGQALVL